MNPFGNCFGVVAVAALLLALLDCGGDVNARVVVVFIVPVFFKGGGLKLALLLAG